MRKICLGGLCLLLLVGTLAIGCRSYTPSSEPPPPPPPDDNICGWPDYCWPIHARDMMQEIKDLAEADEAKEAIDPQDLDSIRESYERITDPMLKNAAGRHVCHLLNPKPCEELAKIHEKIKPENMPVKPAARKGYWHTIAQELESFPTGS